MSLKLVVPRAVLIAVGIRELGLKLVVPQAWTLAGARDAGARLSSVKSALDDSKE